MKWKNAPVWAIEYAEKGYDKYGTPEGVTLGIGELESSFNPAAVNKSSGAIGIMQVIPRFAADYDRMMRSIDPDLKGLDLRSEKAVQGLAAVMRYNYNLAKKRGISGDIEPWQWAMIAHRWGQASQEIKTFKTQKRVLDVERLMKENGCWYTTGGAVFRTLRRGDRGEDVKLMQKALNEKRTGPLKLSEDGIFGTGTENDLKAFQMANGLVADGIFGEKTARELYKA